MDMDATYHFEICEILRFTSWVATQALNDESTDPEGCLVTRFPYLQTVESCFAASQVRKET